MKKNSQEEARHGIFKKRPGVERKNKSRHGSPCPALSKAESCTYCPRLFLRFSIMFPRLYADFQNNLSAFLCNRKQLTNLPGRTQEHSFHGRFLNAKGPRDDAALKRRKAPQKEPL